MTRAHGPSDVLGKAAVEGLLPSLESWTGGPTRVGLLPPHPEAASRSLPGGDTPSLAVLALARAGGRADVGEGELNVLHIRKGGFVGLAALPVVQLHGEGGCGSDGVGNGRTGESRREGGWEGTDGCRGGERRDGVEREEDAGTGGGERSASRSSVKDH